VPHVRLLPTASRQSLRPYSVLSLGVKRPGCEAVLEVKNEWSYAFTSSYTFMAFTATISLLPILCLSCLFLCGHFSNRQSASFPSEFTDLISKVLFILERSCWLQLILVPMSPV